MPHTPEDEKKLLSMSMEDKIKSIQIDALAKAGTLIKQYDYWYLSSNAYPHDDRWSKQYVLRLRKSGKRKKWHKTIRTPNKKAKLELLEIEDDIEKLIWYWDYWIVRNTKSNRSIENYHLHFFSDKKK